jgi:acetate---CoA ligase (ADP-forming)
MTRLDRLLRPRHIAVLGAGWALNVIEQCAKMDFAGPVWPVHPTKNQIGGLKAYASLADLPEAPDATFIGVNRFATIDVVAELAAMGAGARSVSPPVGRRPARRACRTGWLQRRGTCRSLARTAMG